MSSLDLKLSEWTHYRRRLELETRLLVVEEEPPLRRQLDDLLYRQRVSSRSVAGTDQALELLGKGAYPLLMVSETLTGLGGLYLIRQLRRIYPEVDALVSSWEPSLELVSRAFELQVLDVVSKPPLDRQVFSDQIRDAIRRSVDRRMRRYLIEDLRACLQAVPEAARTHTIRQLEHRLTAFKSALGAYDRVLVVEHDDNELRLLSENLLLAGLHVEATTDLEQALGRARDGSIHLVTLASDREPLALKELIDSLRLANPLLEVLLVSRQPDVAQARSALREGAATYLPWPPPSLPAVVERVQTGLRRGRRERLLDNLLLEMFRETYRALGQKADEQSFLQVCQLGGLKWVAAAPSSGLIEALTGETEYLDDMLDNLLGPDESETASEEFSISPLGTAPGAERRLHPRVPESQLLRFRPQTALASVLAMVGDLSEGGVFVRTDDLVIPGTELDLEFHAVHEGQTYLVCCPAQAVWVARDNRQSPMGPGFGLRFVGAPTEVSKLLQRIVASRLRHAR